jgi:hypothetical protein
VSVRFRCDSAPSRLRLIRKSAALARIFPTLDLSIESKAARRKGTDHWGLFAQAELLKLTKMGFEPTPPKRAAPKAAK